MTKGQTSVEYLILVAVGVIIALLAVLGMFHVMSSVSDEVQIFRDVENRIVQVITG